jgi:hypothetical protein
MSYDNLSSVSQNVLKFDQQLTGEERRIPFIFDNFHFCHSRVIGLDMIISKHSEKHYSSYHTTFGKHPIFRHIKSNNSGMAKVKIVKNERDPPLGGSLSFLTIFTFAIPELLDLI